MSKNRLYVYTFFFFFMLCVGITAGSYIVKMNEKTLLEIQTALNPHKGIETNEQIDNNDTIVLQMLFDLYATINASVDTEHAYLSAIMQLQNNADQPIEVQEQTIEEINALLQKNLANYSTRLASVQENVKKSMQAFIQAGIIRETDQKELMAALDYLNKNMNTFAQIGHLILRDENPFAEETTDRATKALNKMAEQRKEIQESIEKYISQKLNDTNGSEKPAIESRDGVVF